MGPSGAKGHRRACPLARCRSGPARGRARPRSHRAQRRRPPRSHRRGACRVARCLGAPACNAASQGPRAAAARTRGRHGRRHVRRRRRPPPPGSAGRWARSTAWRSWPIQNPKRSAWRSTAGRRAFVPGPARPWPGRNSRSGPAMTPTAPVRNRYEVSSPGPWPGCAANPTWPVSTTWLGREPTWLINAGV